MRQITSSPQGKELQEFVETAKILATCPYYQKLGAGGVLAIWLTARELNLPPMACLNGGMYTFSGLVSLSAQLMNMMIVNAGHYVKVIELTEALCLLEFVRTDRKDDTTMRYEDNIEMAKSAGYLGKPNWKQHPRDMLFARALSGGARKFMPDAIMNCYAIGELGKEDGEIEQIMPDLVTDITNESDKILVEISYDEQEKITEFKKRHNYIENEKYTKYIERISSLSKKSEKEIILAAFDNESKFVTCFNKWLEKESKTELVG